MNQKVKADCVWYNANLATMNCEDVIEKGIIASLNGHIIYVGDTPNAPDFDANDVIDASERLITPGFIDGHTHLVYGGNRAIEWEKRLNGESYEAIAKAGGGILSTVKATRTASFHALIGASLPRLDALINEGVTTIEIKSGYGLDLEHETKMLQVARELAKLRDITITTSFLGAHAMPPEYADKDAYIDQVIDMLPVLHAKELIDYVDGFCEGIGFSTAQIARLFDAATRFNLPVKLHAEQLSNLGGASLSARYNALSADHLEYLDENGVKSMAKSGMVAGILPGAFYFLKETQKPPIDLLRHYKVPMMVATDCNPGSSPMTSILLAMNMACTLFGLTPHEALLGVTLNAAQALGKKDQIGSLKIGKQCNLAIWSVNHPAELAYSLGFNPLHSRIFKGKIS